MSELKEFSEVLKQFSSKQKFKVLISLLLFSLLISLGTSFINGHYKSSDELNIIVESQKKSIIDLNNRVNNLQYSLIKDSQSCTDSILSIEKRHVDDMMAQQKYVTEMLNKLKTQVTDYYKSQNNSQSNIIYRKEILNIDTTSSVIDSQSTPIKYQISKSKTINNIDDILGTINTIQNNIKKDVK